MRRGHMGAEEPLGLLGETHEVGKGMCCIRLTLLYISEVKVQHLRHHDLPNWPRILLVRIHTDLSTGGPSSCRYSISTST